MHSAVCPAVNYGTLSILRGWQIKRVTRCDSRPLRTQKRIEVSAAIIKILFLFQIMAMAAYKHNVKNIIERKCISLPTRAYKIYENGLILRFSKTFWNNATYHSNGRNSNFYEIWCQLHATLTQKVYFSRSCKFIAGKDERMHSAVCPAVNYGTQPILQE